MSANNLAIFNFEGQEVRFCGSAKNPEWVAADVGAIMGLEQSTLSRRLSNMPANWKGMYQIHTLGGQQQMLTVTEPGLYELIFRSDKPAALRLKVWVFEEVLPAIRKTGTYSRNSQQSPFSKTSLELMAALTTEMVKIERKVNEHEEAIAELNAQVAQLTQQKSHLKPVASVSAILSAETIEKIIDLAQRKGGTITVRQTQLAINSKWRPKAQVVKSWFEELESMDYGKAARAGKTFSFTIRPQLTVVK